MANEINRVRYHNTRSRDYRVIAANGAQGTIGINGIIQFDLYLQRPALHAEVEQTLDHVAKVLGPELPVDPPEIPTVNREAQVGIVLTPEAAWSLGQWLLSQVKAYQAQIEGLAETQTAEVGDGLLDKSAAG